MVYFRSYWFHLDLMAAVGFELTTLGFRGMAPTHYAIGADYMSIKRDNVAQNLFCE